MMFLDCPAHLDGERIVRCGLPAEVRCWFTMRSTEGPLESAMIGCPVGHSFNGPIGSLSSDGTDEHNTGTARDGFAARHGSLPRSHDGRDGEGGVVRPDFPPRPGVTVRRPNGAPAYYLGRPAHIYLTAMRRNRTASRHPTQAVTSGGEQTPPPGDGLLPGAGARTARMAPAAAPRPGG
jgi:hypothetical protein